MRLAGADYAEIARAGGGIVSTVRATREATEDELFAQSAARLQPLLAEGVTALEIKSGYGLSLEAERKQLRVARRLGEACGVSVHTTFLGAHALPPEYAGRADDYIARSATPCCRRWPQRAGRRGRCLLRIDRLLAGTDRARVRGRGAPRPAGQAARGTAQQPRWRRAGRASSRAVGGPSRASGRGGRGRHGRGRHGGRAAAGRLLFPARHPPAADRCPAPPRCPDRGFHRPQPRHFAGHFAAADDEHGLHPVPHDGARGPGRRDRPRGPRARRRGPPRPAGARARGRFRLVAHRHAGRTGLLVRPQPAGGSGAPGRVFPAAGADFNGGRP